MKVPLTNWITRSKGDVIAVKEQVELYAVWLRENNVTPSAIWSHPGDKLHAAEMLGSRFALETRVYIP